MEIPWSNQLSGGLFAGLETDGIYRVSGNLAVIQKLRFLVDHGEDEGEEEEKTDTLNFVFDNEWEVGLLWHFSEIIKLYPFPFLQ